MIVNNEFDIKELHLVETNIETKQPFTLVVWNDDINTFEWIIESLIEVCQHTEEQAEQCAMIIHFQGKYAVKNGEFEILKPMCNSITERGINATIEEVAKR
jgi:ATP-dependent Clp protease adaptor protein ClpS